MTIDNQLERLQTIYRCREEGTGKAIPFYPRPEQERIFEHLLEKPDKPAYIIKSRRLGLSTGINLFQLDSAVFCPGWTGMLIDRTQEDASRKMTEQIRFGFEHMDSRPRRQYELLKKSDRELRVRLRNDKNSDASTVYAGVSARGGDFSMLHVSEMGPIAARDDARANEIVNGAFPAASRGRTVVETTWMGGKTGRLWDLIEPVLINDPNAEGIIYFFPWHADPEAIETAGMVTEEIEDYFRDLEGRLGKRFDPEQKKWYAAKRIRHRHEVTREYPSTLDEALSSPVEGAIYAPYLDQLITSGRIVDFPIDRSALVHTAWDLGSPFNTVTWYFQLIGREIVIIDCDLELNLTLTERVSRILSKGYPLGTHLLPHDATATPTSGKSVQQDLIQAGLPNTRVVPRTQNVWIGINATEEAMPRMMFHATNCATGLERLQNYRTTNESSSGLAVETPVHDRNSHAADALRMILEGLEAGLVNITGTAGMGRRRRTGQTKVLRGWRGGMA